MNFKHRSQTYTILISLVFSTAFLFAFYGKILSNPNEHIFTGWGDGIKNYYSYAYHIKHDTSYVYFEGMNYPYGELHQFTDGQPFLANLVKAADKVFPVTDRYAIGILNLSMLLSFVVAALFIALVLYEFKISSVFAGIASVVILVLSPQIHRFGGHLSLSYFFAFPMMWYFLIRFYKTTNVFFTGLILLLNLALLFTHPYLGVMNMAFIIACYLSTFFIKLKRPNRLILHTLIQSVLPLIVWLLFFMLYDSHINRPDSVFMDKGLAVLHEVFLPNMGILKNTLNDIVHFRIRWESWAYIGLVSLVVFLILTGKGIATLIKERRFRFFPEYVPQHMRLSFLASIMVLLYAFGIPYATGFRFLLDWVPALQQIRVVARFGWVFFYVMNVLTIVILYNVLLKGKLRKVIGISLMMVVLLTTFLEGMTYHKTYAGRYSENPNYFNRKTDSKLNNGINESLNIIDEEKYQAIIPLPYYHVGNGLFQQEVVDHKGLATSMVFSYHSGLPLTSVMLSRTSTTETKSLLRLTAPPYVNKPALDRFNDKPLLLIVTNRDKVKEEEKWLLKRSSLLTTNELYSIYSIAVSDLNGYNDKSDIVKSQAMPPLKDDSAGRYFTKYFKNNTVNVELDTTKAERRDLGKRVQIFEKSGQELYKGERYEVSFWYYNEGPDRLFSLLQVIQFDPKGKPRRTHNLDLRNELHLGNWTLVTLSFQIKEDTKKLRLFIQGQRESGDMMYFTDFLFRQMEYELSGRINDSLLFFNNRRINLNKNLKK